MSLIGSQSSFVLLYTYACIRIVFLLVTLKQIALLILQKYFFLCPLFACFSLVSLMARSHPLLSTDCWKLACKKLLKIPSPVTINNSECVFQIADHRSQGVKCFLVKWAQSEESIHGSNPDLWGAFWLNKLELSRRLLETFSLSWNMLESCLDFFSSWDLSSFHLMVLLTLWNVHMLHLPWGFHCWEQVCS